MITLIATMGGIINKDRVPTARTGQTRRMVSFSAISSFGIFQRRTISAIALAISYVMLALLLPFVESAPDEPLTLVIRQRPLSLSELIWQAETFPTVLSLVSAIGTAVFTCIYFRERWSLLR